MENGMKKNLLIVDDDLINLKLFTIIADKNSWSYDTASDGEEVKKLLDANLYDVMLLDIQLPGIDGFSILKSLRAEKKQVRVIAVTAYAIMGDREKILQAGADDYLAKPVDIDNLISKIKQNLPQ
jgi:DNA-binding response OmpR family regulator